MVYITKFKLLIKESTANSEKNYRKLVDKILKIKNLKKNNSFTKRKI